MFPRTVRIELFLYGDEHRLGVFSLDEGKEEVLVQLRGRRGVFLPMRRGLLRDVGIGALFELPLSKPMERLVGRGTGFSSSQKPAMTCQ